MANAGLDEISMSGLLDLFQGRVDEDLATGPGALGVGSASPASMQAFMMNMMGDRDWWNQLGFDDRVAVLEYIGDDLSWAAFNFDELPGTVRAELGAVPADVVSVRVPSKSTGQLAMVASRYRQVPITESSDESAARITGMVSAAGGVIAASEITDQDTLKAMVEAGELIRGRNDLIWLPGIYKRKIGGTSPRFPPE
jgi:hypothetical protein